MPKVTLAAGEDVQAIIELNQQIQGLHAELYPEDFKPQADPAERQALFTRIMADSAHVLAVYRDSSQVEGYVWLEVQERPETALIRSAKRIHIHHLVVADVSRRRRIGSELMRWVEEYAASAGARQIVLEHWAANEAARAFFSRSGFSSLKMTLRKEVVCGA
jgi:ribosomal protein S18 acetylase RimI-like enzyme